MERAQIRHVYADLFSVEKNYSLRAVGGGYSLFLVFFFF